ncbi:MAG TPA: single-stranded-DNA-specific exonuclease RecJ, partial [Peptostreptococcaceae bacterium]|nr:single-stranded-DNA-specific exonuclease RecJ [Peptostreptococcaceae bacterium]
KKDGLCDKLDISPEISQILKNRGINDEKDADIFMNPSLEHLYDPFLMKDMEKSVDRIKKAIENNERIWIYGDYDVDGVSSTSILYIYFKSINYNVNYYIPNRLEEGYGLNKEAIEKIIKSGCDLIITVDCGITSVEEVEFAKNSGVDVIVTDHHECQEKIPDAYAIINPKQEECNYPFEPLCGCGVAFKLIQALTPKDEFEISMYNYLEIVTFATICDIVPLVGENRIIVKNGLKLMKNGKNLGIKSLIKICGIDTEKISSSHIGFSLGPRINASGRLGYSYLGVQLFISKHEEEAMELAMLLEEKNNERQMIESKMYKEAEEIIANDPRYIDEKVLVVAKENWQHGVIGIVASKLTEKYYKPTILLTIEEGEGRGSARSIKGFSIFEALLDCSDLLNRFGGHEQAAGLSLDEEKIKILRQKINEKAEYKLNDEDMVENINIELELNEDVVSFELIDELHKLEPFGMNNPSPRFIMRDLEMIDIRCIGKERQHLKFKVKKKYEYDCIGFNMAYLATKFKCGDKVDLLFQVDENTYMGNKKIQFLLKDVRMSYPKDVNKNPNLSKLIEYIKPIDFNYSINSYMDINGDKDINIFDHINENTLII